MPEPGQGELCGFVLCHPPQLGICSTQKCCSPASSLGLLRAAGLSTGETGLRGAFVRAWHLSCSTGTRCWSRLGLTVCQWCHRLHTQPLLAEMGCQTNSLTSSFLPPITSALAAFGDFRAFGSHWYLWRRSPKPFPSLQWPLLDPSSPSNKTGVKSGCFLQAAGPAAELSAQLWMLHPCTGGKRGFPHAGAIS